MLNGTEHVKASSQTKFSCLTPERQMERFVNVKMEIQKLRQKCLALSNRLVYLSASESEVISKDDNPKAFDLIEKVFNSFKGKNDVMMKTVLDAMIMKLYHDKKKVTNMKDEDYKEALSNDEQFECKELSSIFMEQMKSNAMRMNQKEKGIRFSTEYCGWLCPFTSILLLDIVNSRSHHL